MAELSLKDLLNKIEYLNRYSAQIKFNLLKGLIKSDRALKQLNDLDDDLNILNHELNIRLN